MGTSNCRTDLVVVALCPSLFPSFHKLHDLLHLHAHWLLLFARVSPSVCPQLHAQLAERLLLPGSAVCLCKRDAGMDIQWRCSEEGEQAYGHHTPLDKGTLKYEGMCCIHT